MKKLLLILSLFFAVQGMAQQHMMHTLASQDAGEGITYIGGNSNSSSSASSITITKPTGTTDDDILVSIISINGNTTPSSVPSGWTLIDTGTDVPSSGRSYTYWKRASSEGSNYTWSWSGAQRNSGIIINFRGCISSGSPVDAHSVNNSEETSDTPLSIIASSITTTTTNTMIVWMGTYDNSWAGTWTAPTNFTLGANVVAGSGSATAYKIQESTGATGDVTGIASSGTGDTYNWGFLIALK